VTLAHFHLTHAFSPAEILSDPFFCEVMHNFVRRLSRKSLKLFWIWILVADSRQILRPKCTKFDFGWGSAHPQTRQLVVGLLQLAKNSISRSRPCGPSSASARLFSRIFLSQPWHVCSRRPRHSTPRGLSALLSQMPRPDWSAVEFNR